MISISQPSTVEAMGLLPTGGAYGTTVLPRQVPIVGNGSTGPYPLGLAPVNGSLRVFRGPLKCDNGVHYTVLANAVHFTTVLALGDTASAEFFG